MERRVRGFEGPRVADGSKLTAASQLPSFLASQHTKIPGANFK